MTFPRTEDEYDGKPSCGECHYFIFIGLDKCCRHPDSIKILEKFKKRCSLFQDNSPVVIRNFKERLTINETIERLGRK